MSAEVTNHRFIADAGNEEESSEKRVRRRIGACVRSRFPLMCTIIVCALFLPPLFPVSTISLQQIAHAHAFSP